MRTASKGTGGQGRRLALILLLMLLIPAQSLALTVQARFKVDQNPISWPIDYEDSFFDKPGTDYQQDLATASLGMALSAFRRAGAPLQESHLDIQAFFQEAGFDKAAYSQYDQTPSIDTIATAIAQKQLKHHTLIAIAISGGGYKDEWQSNFTIGDSLHHSGFDGAARQVLARYKDYVQRHGLGSRGIKLWISGYSRAAATANRLGALLQDEGLIAPENLYDYGFATPNTTKQQNAENYPSIYSIVGAFDPVPMVPLRDWGFRRFGQSYVLPAPQLNSDYLRRVEPVTALHLKYTGIDYWSNFSGTAAVNKLLSSLSETVKNSSEYSRKLQPLLMDLWNKRARPARMLGSFLQHVTLRESSMRRVLLPIFSIFSNAAGEQMLQSEGQIVGQWHEDKSLKENLAREHYPEGYLAWMSAYHSLDEMKSPHTSYRQIVMHGFEQVEVQDSKQQPVAAYRLAEGQQYLPKGNAALWFSPEGDDLLISLPADQHYSLVLTPIAGDTMNLRVREGQAGRTRLKVYDSGPLPAADDKERELQLPALDGQEAAGSASYLLTGGGASHKLTWQPNATALSSRELDSRFTTMFGRSLLTLAAVLLLVVVLLLFSIALLVRAWRRGRHKRRLRRAGTPLGRASFRQSFLCRTDQCKLPIKLLALLVLISSGSIAWGALTLLMAWIPELQMAQSSLLYNYSILYNLPVLVLFLGAALPAQAAALHALLWLKDNYLLRSSRLFALIALLFSLSLALVLFLPGEFLHERSMMATAGIQMLLLVLMLRKIGRVLKGQGA